jgi:hypothetical protein
VSLLKSNLVLIRILLTILRILKSLEGPHTAWIIRIQFPVEAKAFLLHRHIQKDSDPPVVRDIRNFLSWSKAAEE